MIWRIAHERSDSITYSQHVFGGGGYSDNYYYFNSNWCETQTQSIYRIKLPTVANGYATNWYEDLAGEAPADTSPPTIYNPLPSGTVNCTGETQDVTLAVTTDEDATCKYDTNAAHNTYDTMDYTFTTTGTRAHTQTLSSLACSTTHTYYIACADDEATPNKSDPYEHSFDIGAPPEAVAHQGSAYFQQTSYSSIGTSQNYAFIVTKPSLECRTALETRKGQDETIKAIFYDNALTHGETYYVLDAVTGDHVVNDDWGWVLMDISNADYRAELATFIASQLTLYSIFDGVFLDDVWYSITASEFHQEGGDDGDDPTLPADLVTNWQTYMAALLSAIKTAIGSDLLIINGGIFEATYIAEVDGCMDENWSDRPNWISGVTAPDYSTWENHMDAVDDLLDESKYYVAQSGVSDWAYSARWNRFAFASYLMKVRSTGSSLFTYGFEDNTIYSGDSWTGYGSEWEKAALIGAPSGDYAAVDGETYVFRRDFSTGTVLVNVNSSPSGNISTSYGTVSIPAYDGLILYEGYDAQTSFQIGAGGGDDYSTMTALVSGVGGPCAGCTYTFSSDVTETGALDLSSYNSATGYTVNTNGYDWTFSSGITFGDYWTIDCGGSGITGGHMIGSITPGNNNHYLRCMQIN